ncbi:MAG: Ser-Thr-rich GPI-anchored membrane family protein [Ignavibacteriaceae bacterium]
MPNGGEVWQAGSSQTISWTDNINENVTINLYKGGSFHSVIESSTASDGTRNWSIPFTLEAGSDYRIKIASIDDPAIADFSDADFTIIGNQIKVTSPNGGEKWLDTKDYIIEWADNITENVEIQLLKNNLFYSSITTSTPSDNAYTWNISNNVETGSDYKIKIISVTDGNVFDLSDDNFTIINNSITVTTPNGGEIWLIGTNQSITWTDDLPGEVKIELYKAEQYNQTVANSTTSNGLYQWNITESIVSGSDYKIKISSVDYPELFDMSNNSFSILAGSITVNSPNGGNSLLAGEQYTISWSDNITGEVIIELYKNGVLHPVYPLISGPTPSDGSKSWDIPFDIETDTNYKIKITSVDNESIFDYSDNNFTIEGFSITVTSPNGGENWFASSNESITWNSNLTSNVEIQLFKGGEFHSIINGSTSNDGNYSWSISSSLTTDSDYKIKIASVKDADIFDFSDFEFTIINNNIALTSPNGGENWLIGSTHEITWTDDISGNVRIDLYKAGVLNSTIVPSTPSDGSFNWNFSGVTPGSDYRIKIISNDQSALFDLSNNDFTLFTGDITITSPNGGENWLANSSQTIFWTDNINGDVIIDLYKGGSFHSNISGPTSSDGAKNWTLPFDIESGDNYKVKITSFDNNGIYDFSDEDFNIEGFEITVISPNGGETWYVGQDYNITWIDNLEGNIDIQLWKGGVFHSVIDATDPSDGIKTWSIPQTQETGSDFTIKISSLENNNIFDFSENTFTLAHKVLIVTPNGGESWQAGSNHTISWSDNLTGNIRIELWKNDAFHSELESSVPSDGDYTWYIDPSLQADINYKIKIISVEDTAVYDFSNNNFEIFAGSITIVSPNDGEIWQAGESRSIIWTDNINENVQIELYKGGSLHSNIVASTSSDGTYNWSIPFTLESGSDYKVKITSVNSSVTFDYSNSNFTIVGKEITITAPNGGESQTKGETYFITWDDNLSGNVEILLFKGGILKDLIENSTPSDGIYTWQVSSNLPSGSDYQIKIASLEESSIFDFSDAEFTISDVSSVENISNEIPDIYTLYQNYPNPFNPRTKIEFGLPEESSVTLKVYDITGQEVNVVLNNENLYPGKYRVDFDASYLPSGIYFYLLLAKSNTSDLAIRETKKMILMK